MVLENHAGPHDPNYHLEVQRRLDAEYRALGPGKSAEAYTAGINRVSNGIIRDIDNGTLRPYVNKDVKVIEIIPARPQAQRNGTLNTKGSIRRGPGLGGKLFMWIDIIQLLDMGIIEYRMQTEPPKLEPHPVYPNSLMDQFGRTWN